MAAGPEWLHDERRKGPNGYMGGIGLPAQGLQEQGKDRDSLMTDICGSEIYMEGLNGTPRITGEIDFTLRKRIIYGLSSKTLIGSQCTQLTPRTIQYGRSLRAQIRT
jgi:hypothetical protein